MLGFMSITGIFGLGNIRNLKLDIAFPDEIYAGMPTQLTLRLHCRGGLFPAYLLELFLCGKSISFPVLDRKEGATGHLLVVFDRRGRGDISPPYVSSPFPIGFFVRSLPLPVETDFIVFPTPIPPPAGFDDAGRKSRGEQELPKAGSGGDLYSINDYTGTESLRQIHWRLSARHDTLKVKQYGAAVGEPVVVDLAKLPGNTEARLGMATHLVNRLHRSGRAVGLKIGGELLPPAHGRTHRLKLLREIALYDTP